MTSSWVVFCKKGEMICECRYTWAHTAMLPRFHGSAPVEELTRVYREHLPGRLRKLVNISNLFSTKRYTYKEVRNILEGTFGGIKLGNVLLLWIRSFETLKRAGARRWKDIMFRRRTSCPPTPRRIRIRG